jgi:hypothetical protein
MTKVATQTVSNRLGTTSSARRCATAIPLVKALCATADSLAALVPWNNLCGRAPDKPSGVSEAIADVITKLHHTDTHAKSSRS